MIFLTLRAAFDLKFNLSVICHMILKLYGVKLCYSKFTVQSSKAIKQTNKNSLAWLSSLIKLIQKNAS